MTSGSLLSTAGRCIFSAAIAALGVETIICARDVDHSVGPRYGVIPVIPWLPAIPWLAYAFGATLVLCAVGLLLPRRIRPASLALGALLFLCCIALDVPKNAEYLSSISLRTAVFETLALACLASLQPGRAATPRWLSGASRYLLAISLVVFGVDHFLDLRPIAGLLPHWIPWPVFWVAFFGAAFLAGGLSIALDWLQRAGGVWLGVMFAIWVFTLHLPRVLGLYGIPGAPSNPDEWSSLFIAVGLWGGLWTID